MAISIGFYELFVLCASILGVIALVKHKAVFVRFGWKQIEIDTRELAPHLDSDAKQGELSTDESR